LPRGDDIRPEGRRPFGLWGGYCGRCGNHFRRYLDSFIALAMALKERTGLDL
jgi:hypothetical protein